MRACGEREKERENMFAATVGASLLTQFKGHIELKAVRAWMCNDCIMIVWMCNDGLFLFMGLYLLYVIVCRKRVKSRWTRRILNCWMVSM